MEKNNRRIATAAALGMLVLIFDGKTALTGAADGITLCLSTLIPSIFPFILLSVLLTGALAGQAIRPLKWITSICKMPAGTESLFVISFLGGYPTGAQNVAQLYHLGQLPLSAAMRMLALCNHAGPAFIFGVLGAQFSKASTAWILWITQIFSSICVGLLFPGDIPSTPVYPSSKKIRVMDAIPQAVKTTGLICGWVVLMRMILAFFDSWFLWLLPQSFQVILSGILELSNGCVRLADVKSEGLRFLIASCLLPFGGICVTLQTASVAGRIPMNQYLPEKILQTGISVFLGCILQFIFPPASRFMFCTPVLIISVIAILFVLFAQHFKNSSGNPAAIGV